MADYQRVFEFDHAESLRKWKFAVKNYIIEQCVLPRDLKALIQQFHRFSGSDRFCFPGLKKLSLNLGYRWPNDRRTLQRKIKALKDLGLLEVEDDYRVDGGQKSNKYRIVWGNLQRTFLDGTPQVQDVANLKPPHLKVTPGGATKLTPPRVIRVSPPSVTQTPPPSASQGVAGGRSPGCRPIRTIKNQTEPTTPPQSTIDELWHKVGGEMMEFGIRSFETPIEFAKSRVTPEHVLALIAHARAHPGAWEALDLRNRILVASHEKAVDEGWPPTSEKYRAKHRSKAQAAKRSAEDDERDAQQRLEREEYERLNADHGARLDAIAGNRRTLEELCRQAGVSAYKTKLTTRDKAASSIYRRPLLEFLANQREVETQ